MTHLAVARPPWRRWILMALVAITLIVTAPIWTFVTAIVGMVVYTHVAAEITEASLPAEGRPWIGPDERVRMLTRISPCIMCPTATETRTRWGRRFGSGEEPHLIAYRAFRYLHLSGAMSTWAEGGTSWTGDVTIKERKAPFRFHLVSVEPTVVLMRPDPRAATEREDPATTPFLSTPWVSNRISYGTVLPPAESWLWFSPELDTPPTALGFDAGGTAAIALERGRLVLRRLPDRMVVTRE